MIRVIKISLILIAFPYFGFSQSLKCMYDELVIKAYQEKDYLKAKAYSDSTLSLCPELFDNAYVWHVRGFVMWNVYKVGDSKRSNSPAREEALEALNRSLVLVFKKGPPDAVKINLETFERFFLSKT